MELTLRWPLCVVLLDLEDRKEASWLYRPDTVRSDDADNKHLHDLKCRDPLSGRCDRSSWQVSNFGKGTRSGIANFGINGFDGGLRIAVIEGDEAFHLLLCVAYQGSPELNVGSLRRRRH